MVLLLVQGPHSCEQLALPLYLSLAPIQAVLMASSSGDPCTKQVLRKIEPAQTLGYQVNLYYSVYHYRKQSAQNTAKISWANHTFMHLKPSAS